MGITDYLTHFGISLLLAVLYFMIQYDYSQNFKKQKDLMIMSSGVFGFIFFICFIVVKIPKQVTFGDNEVKEFEDDDGEEEEEEEEGEEEEQPPVISTPFPNIPEQSPQLPTQQIPPLPTS